MRTQIEILENRISEACNSTKPRTKARNAALAKVRWRLETIDGLCAGFDEKFGCALVLPESALVFDGRDNEKLKKWYYEKTLGVELAVVLLD